LEYTGRNPIDLARHGGRTFNATEFYDDTPTRVLLRRLGRRGFVVGYGFSNGDGIHGWLSADETSELAT
jgi:hypothetical protein